MPALWAVHFGGSVPGDTAATITDTLAANSSLPTDANGDTLVEANTIQEAIGLAIIGDVTVQFGGQTLIYSMAPGNVGASFAEHRPFVGSSSVIQLEDMTYSANGSDWDYNDRSWLVSVTDVSGGGSPPTSPPTSPPPPYGYPTFVWITAGAGTTETSPTNGWFVVNRNNTAGALTVNFGVVASTAADAATLDLDYTILGSGSSVTFAAGASQAFVYIHPLIDTVYGPYGPPDEPFENEIERVTLALSAGTGYTVYTPNEAFIQIGNVDLVFDLDVNADGDLLDAVDLAKNYLPGYEGNTAKVSTGSRFNVPAYTGQHMMLVVNGIGTESVDVVNKVEFIIVQVSADPGYTGNRTDPNLEGQGKTEDYSFRRIGREGPIGTPSVITIERNGPAPSLDMHGGAYGGKMEATNTWVNFWCKDYGGASRLLAKIYIADANAPNGERIVTRALSVPLDDDLNGGDGIADKWEIAMGARWSAQSGVAALTPLQAMQRFIPADDGELPDPDGAGALVEQGKPAPNLPGETGDAHTVKEEYRGYVLDGGSGGFGGGHIRLDPARKEILVEVDRAAVLNNVPGAGNDTNAKLKTILNGASGVFSNATRGAGIYMYWLMDEDALAAPTAVDLLNGTALGDTRDTVSDRPLTTVFSLANDFLHLIFVDKNLGTAALTKDSGEIHTRGSMIDATHMNTWFGPGNAHGFTKMSEAYSTTIAHELTHLLVDRANSVGWDEDEHVVGAVETYSADLMYGESLILNRELATVKITDRVQESLKIKNNQGF